MESPLKHSDVVFMYAADAETYRAYNATWVAWGGASKESVETAHSLRACLKSLLMVDSWIYLDEILKSQDILLMVNPYGVGIRRYIPE